MARTALFARTRPGGVMTIDDFAEHPGEIWFVSSVTGSTSNAETAVPTAKSVAFGPLTLNVANAGNAKVGTATLYILGERLPAA